jgi:hypothetical protein
LDAGGGFTRDAEAVWYRFGRNDWWLASPACRVGVPAMSWWWLVVLEAV